MELIHYECFFTVIQRLQQICIRVSQIFMKGNYATLTFSICVVYLKFSFKKNSAYFLINHIAISSKRFFLIAVR